MSFAVHKLLWLLLHWVADLIERIYFACLRLQRALTQRWTRKQSHKTEYHIIQNNINHLQKSPQHLAVILNLSQEKADYESLTKLIFWSLQTGISYISFYDYQGFLRKDEETFHKHVELRKGSDEQIVWGPKYQLEKNFTFPHKNGYLHHIVVNFYAADDGKIKLGQIMREDLCSATSNKTDSVKHIYNNITIDLIEEKLRATGGRVPDPDVAIHFGALCSTFGLLPWQIRLTEFMRVSWTQQDLQLDKFLKVLYKYAKVEQRFGY